MGRLVLGGVFALIAALQPALARAQWQPRAQEPPAPAAPAAPAYKPWREAMARAPEPEREQPSKRVWYGWQTLILDLSGAGLLALAVEEPVSGAVGLAVIGLGSPIAHFAHGNNSQGAISFAIRATAIGLFFLGGVLISDGFDDDIGTDDTREAVGTVALIASIPGALSAVVIDASLLAFEAGPREGQRTSLAPWIDPRRESYGVRLALSL